MSYRSRIHAGQNPTADMAGSGCVAVPAGFLLLLLVGWIMLAVIAAIVGP